MNGDKKNKLRELMERPDKGARSSENLLTLIFRDLLTELEVTERQLLLLMETYLRDPRRDIEDDVRNDPQKFAVKLANDRGNLRKEIERDEFTFKVFMKLIEMLRPKLATLSFGVLMHDGKLVTKQYFLDPTGDGGVYEVTEAETLAFKNELKSIKSVLEKDSVFHENPEDVDEPPKKDNSPVEEDDVFDLIKYGDFYDESDVSEDELNDNESSEDMGSDVIHEDDED